MGTIEPPGTVVHLLQATKQENQMLDWSPCVIHNQQTMKLN